MELSWRKFFLFAAVLLVGNSGLVWGAELSTFLTSGGHVLGFYPDRLVLAARDHAVTVAFAGARPVTPAAGKTSPGESLESEAKVVYSSLWRDIDLVYEKTPQGVIKSTYRVNPGGDPAAIRLRYNQPVQINDRGELVVRYESGEWREAPPIAWEEWDGGSKPVSATYRRMEDGEIGFSVSGWKGDTLLVIDPVATWNTFQGSSYTDYTRGVAVDGNGYVYITGTSRFAWGGFQTNPNYQFLGTADSNANAFVAKFDGETGVLIWNAFLGSGGVDADDYGNGLTLDESGHVYVIGTSFSTWGTNPTRGFSGGQDAFVAKLSTTTGELLKHTFLGATSQQGVDLDSGKKIAVKNGKVYLVGTSSGSWLGAPPPKQSYGGGGDAFVAQIKSEDLAIDWYTFLGSYLSLDQGEDLAVDIFGNSYVVGTSIDSWGGATIVRPHSIGTDAFVAKVGADGSLRWSSFLGSGAQFYGTGIAVDHNGNFCYAAGYGRGGWTEDPIHPYSGNDDAFVAKLSADIGALEWHTFLGSVDSDYATALTIDGSGDILVAGLSLAEWGEPIRPYASGTVDAFALKLKDTGERIWNTFLGGTGDDYGYSIAVDAGKSVYVVGKSNANWAWGSSPVEPYHGPQSQNYFDDGFVIKLAYRTISGTVTIGGSPQGGVPVTITGGLPTSTDSNGYYRFIVSDGWSGTVKPDLSPYTFNPDGRYFPNISQDEVQNFTTIIMNLTISGFITEDGNPVPDVEVVASDGISTESTVTNSQGWYQISEQSGWHRTITPWKDGYTFNPANKSYTPLIKNETQDFSGTWHVYISGHVYTRSGGPFPNVVLNGLPSDPNTGPIKTDGNGFYQARVRSGWAGTVTPVFDHALFTTDDPRTPSSVSSRTYLNVTGLEIQNYYGDPAHYLTGEIKEGSSGVPEVLLTADNNGGGAVTDGSGSYILAVIEGWSGRVTPSKPGYAFKDSATEQFGYINFPDPVFADQTDQNFLAEWQVFISGYVKKNTGDPLPDVTMYGLPGTPVTNPSGYYISQVSNNWSGEVTPVLNGFIIGPPSSKIYDNLHQPAANQDYTAYPAAYLSGFIREADGTPVRGVIIAIETNDPPATTATDDNGAYRFAVKKGLTPVTFTPIQPGYNFAPPLRSYPTGVNGDSVVEHFTANWLVYISGSITKNAGGGLGGVLLKGLPGNPQTDPSGNYRVRVGYEWSGTVTPALLGYRFDPESWAYDLVTTEEDRDYTAFSVPIHTISGQIRASGAPLTGITLNASSGEAATTDGNGNFQMAFNEGWSGTVTPTAGGYTFSPPRRTYGALISDLVAQDFISGSSIYLPLIIKP